MRHVGIVVRDMDKMKEFYSVYGNVIQDTVEKVRIVKFDNGIELLEYESQSENTLRQHGISHVAFTQDPEGNYIENVKLQRTD